MKRIAFLLLALSMIAVPVAQAQTDMTDRISDPDLTGIYELTPEALSREVEGYYNLNGQRIPQPARGITIVKFRDGHSEKMKRE